MIWKSVTLGVVALLMLAACAGAPADQRAAGEADAPTVTVYKPPT